ncbi:MAG TPA: dTMP kinase [Vicinamibacteria bacterium]|nr:dTMP kinase [Vicinamibacteria bacterium]
MFLTLEGIEGCGKSTQARLLARRLRREGHPSLLTREPGGTSIGRQIRQVILSTKNHGMSAEAELGLYFSDRAQHLREVVWPALEAGLIVVCDRFTDSTIAYQGYGRGLPLRRIRSIDKALTGGFRPDITLLFDLAPAQGLRRARSRNRASVSRSREGRFEEEDLQFHERVRAGYLGMARRESKRFLVVPADGSRARVHELVWERLRRRRVV